MTALVGLSCGRRLPLTLMRLTLVWRLELRSAEYRNEAAMIDVGPASRLVQRAGPGAEPVASKPSPEADSPCKSDLSTRAIERRPTGRAQWGVVFKSLLALLCLEMTLSWLLSFVPLVSAIATWGHGDLPSHEQLASHGSPRQMVQSKDCAAVYRCCGARS